MKILIKQAFIVDPHSPFNGQTTPILIENGIITHIGDGAMGPADREISLPGLHVSPGWVDIFAHFSDPGYEYKETLETGAAAAAAGGFTDVFVLPNTRPVIHDKAGVEYITHKSRDLPVRIHPIGAVTRNTEGKELAEMYDMRGSGAMAFSDGLQAVQSAGLLVKALQYVKAFDGTIIQLPDDKSINPHGLMHEGIVSTRLGLPGKPAMAEELIVARDIKLAQYAASKLHFTGVSTPASLQNIRDAKSAGTAVTCSVTPAHLWFCDEDLQEYDSNLKLNPPLRSREYRESLKEAVLSGVVDCIASHHQPHEFDSKVMEFEYARYGMTALETTFAVTRTALPGLSLQQLVELLAINPRRIFGLPDAGIREGNRAALSFFDPACQWEFDTAKSRSRSRNSPFHGIKLTGKALGILNGDSIVINE